MNSLFTSSISVLKTGVPNVPVPELHSHFRNIALGFNKIFSEFAVRVCGCEEPGDRVKLRKAVWLQTAGLKLNDFQKGSASLQREETANFLEILAKTECPVQILSKKTASGDETSPSKIIMASKLLRAHLGISEATVCRGCSKRGRCPFARKIVPNNSMKTSLGAVSKILYGLSQSCRLYLKDPERYPLVISGEEMEAAVDLVEKLTQFLEPTALERQLKNVPVAERKAVKAIVERKLKTKQAREEKRIFVKKFGMPSWMASQFIPDTGEKQQPKKKEFKFDLNSEDWVPEEQREQLSKPNLVFSESRPSPSPVRTTSLDRLEDAPIPQRFPNIKQAKFARSDKKLHVLQEKINLEKVGIKKSQPDPARGYVVGTAEPSGGVEYIKPQFLKGKTVLDNVSLASRVWESSSSEKILKNIKRVPFHESPAKNGAVDPLLAKVLHKQHLGRERKAQNYEDTVSEETRFEEWKQRRTAEPVSVLEKDGFFVVSNNTGLQFPKLPVWDPAKLNPKTDKQYRSLMRPESEQRRSAAALERKKKTLRPRS